MSIPQRHTDESDDRFPILIELEPGAKQQLADLGNDYDPEAAVALLCQFMDKPSEDPEADWAEFLAFARAIDEDRGSGRKLFEKYLTE
jgi:hypothetical protein